MSLIVTGSIGIDSVEAPTGVAEDVLGGSTIYFAAAASYFGPVRIVGAVGADFPDPYWDTFKHFNVDLTGVERRAGSKTFRWRGKYMDDMNVRETLSVELNVLAEALPSVPESYRDSRYIFLANTDPASQMDLLSNFPDRTFAVADTMDLWIKTQREKVDELLTQIDGLVLNDSEAVLLTDQTNMVRAAEKILEAGPRFVVIKKGEHGSFLLHHHGAAALPAYPTRQVIDPTGAGDSFAGGMMGFLAAPDQGGGDLSVQSLRTAMAYGTVIASFNIESFSLDRLMQVKRGDLQQRFEEFRNMIRIGD